MLRRVHLPALALLLGACSPETPKPPPAIGEAFAGPATLNIRRDLALHAPVVATVAHGERLEIVEWRRRFARVRTSAGVEGWADGNQFLRPEQMERLRELAASARRMPSHGRATVNDPLNVHTEPHRQAPSFYQIHEGDSVEVIRHATFPRTAFQSARPAPPPPPKRTPRRKKKKAEFEPPPMPAPPAPPVNWIELSRSPFPKPPPVVRSDDWTLVRIPDGRAGWVLTRPLIMSIPDEVAQYAEGHRITSYFSLGEVAYRGETRHHWLWTTLSTGLVPYQFDSFRVFAWSQRRKRYETAYIERNLRGYFPVRILPPEGGEARSSFSLVVQNKDGTYTERTYAFRGHHVRLIGKAPWQPTPEERRVPPPKVTTAAPEPAGGRTLLARVADTVREWRRAVLGR
jgi:hypothetical protein